MARDWGQRFAVREGRIGRVLLVFMALGFAALIAAGIAAAWATKQNRTYSEWVIHTYKVEVGIGDTRRLIEQGETARRGYLLAPDTRMFLATYRQTANELPVMLDRLGVLVADNPEQRTRLVELRRLIAELSAARGDTISRIVRGDVVGAVARFREDLGTTRMQTIRTLLDTMKAEERGLLRAREADLSATVSIFYAILTGAAILLLLLAIVSFVTISRYTRDLAASRDALRDMNASLEGAVAERTADLSRANEEIQRFAYIVSHDLRSPLVNVMGFTAELESAATLLRELLDRAEEAAPDIVTEDARLAVREDLPEAIGFIRSSTQKMDRLIAAILTLARQGRRVLNPEPLDVTALVKGIRDSFAHRLDENGASIGIEGVLPPIVSDRLALEQILSNLIENAVKYLQPGRPGEIVVRGGRDSMRLWYSVADNGRGIAAADHSRIFDLFRRSGAQDQPGEGIGLANVRALAYRLGGTVDVASTLGEGTTFRLSLPPTLQSQDRSE